LKTGILLSELLGTITRSETFVGSEAANHTALPEICQTLFGTLRDYLIVATTASSDEKYSACEIL
jgi:hypothetical protein